MSDDNAKPPKKSLYKQLATCFFLFLGGWYVYFSVLAIMDPGDEPKTRAIVYLFIGFAFIAFSFFLDWVRAAPEQEDPTPPH